MSAQDIQEIKDSLRDLSRDVQALAVEVATMRGSRRVELWLLGAVGVTALGAVVTLLTQ